jgi:N6-L-threonylcarbamoyladenine synthase
VGEYEFSFSGLKTSIRNFLIKGKKQDPDFIKENEINICASVQSTIVTILLDKLENAAHKLRIKNVAIAGGVSANSSLREGLKVLCEKNGWNSFIPKFSYCTDNAAMIAISAYYKFKKEQFVDQTVTPEPRMKMSI